ncbi:restriction endonuclease subunit S [Empedobacter falsenii]
MSYKKLGDYIELIDDRNKGLLDYPLLGVSVQKCFIPSIANTVGTDFSKYKILSENEFTYIPDTSRRGDKIGVALLKDYEKALVSQAYTTFRISDINKLLPEYLMMWFTRPEFDRYARYHSIGSVREVFDWEDMCNVELPVPSIEKQHEIVAQYQAVENKIKVNEQICEKLEATAQALYKQWFVDFEFPCLPSGYRPHGQVNQNLSIDEYITKIGSVCTYSKVGGLPVSDGKTWFVYLILCENDSVYKGITNDLYRRFYEHYMGEGAEWTKLNKPLKVIHWESFATKEEAAKREKDLKTGYGRTWISRQIEKAGGITQLKTSLAAPQTELRTAGKMVYNQELEKEIPEGWEVKSFTDTIKLTGGGTPSTDVQEYWNGTIPFFTPADIQKSYYSIETIKSITELGLKESSTKLYPKDTVFITARGTVGAIGLASRDMAMNQSCYAIKNNLPYYTHQKTLDVIEKLKGEAVGAVFSALVTKDFEQQIILEPNESIKLNFNNSIKYLYDLLLNKSQENQKLTQLQSLLLSRLATLEG